MLKCPFSLRVGYLVLLYTFLGCDCVQHIWPARLHFLTYRVSQMGGMVGQVGIFFSHIIPFFLIRASLTLVWPKNIEQRSPQEISNCSSKYIPIISTKLCFSKIESDVHAQFELSDTAELVWYWMLLSGTIIIWVQVGWKKAENERQTKLVDSWEEWFKVLRQKNLLCGTKSGPFLSI